jgi:hypothetical protein
MPQFQGSGFAIELPETSADASSYCFVFPDAGDFAPNLVIQFERRSAPPDLAQESRKLQQSQLALGDYRVIGEATYKSGRWDYTVCVSEWGPAGNRIRQKQVLLFVPEGKPTLFTLTATDLAGNFSRSEPLFDRVIGSFKPNMLQTF